MDGSIERKLTPPQFIRAGVFMCRHIHREGNGGPFLFRCTAGSTVATCVHRIGHMAHSTQLTIPAMHAHIKATESIILILSLSTGSKTLLPRTPKHTHAIAQAAVTRSTRQIHRAHHTRRKGDSGWVLPPPSFHSCPRRRQQPPATASTRYKRSIQIHCNVYFVRACGCVCACRHTKQRSKNRSRAYEGTHKQNCTAEVHGRNKEKKLLRLTILHCSPSSGNSLKI
ncbi:hypothetical protein ECC02_007933 [Trypanosoma cruzi]|uniref:Uncharacterized protein n=1 Tax=Trypanosoma cruzi TaxID=5693 RepID=A0A7J6XYJ9_TRYCR|nr:hypothetical protein ECC02_007933 [Trypanosoma cruzi]